MLIAKRPTPLFLKKGRFWCRFLLIFKIGERIVFGAAFCKKRLYKIVF